MKKHNINKAYYSSRDGGYLDDLHYSIRLPRMFENKQKLKKVDKLIQDFIRQADNIERSFKKGQRGVLKV